MGRISVAQQERDRRRTDADPPPKAYASASCHTHDLGSDGWSDVLRQLAEAAGRPILNPNSRLRVAVDGAAFGRIEDLLAEADVFSTPLFRRAKAYEPPPTRPFNFGGT